MADSDIIKKVSIQRTDTINRYLLRFNRDPSIDADVLSFAGEEKLSHPYRYTVRFTCSVKNLPLNNILNCPATFLIRAPNPETWDKKNPWLPQRQVNGIVTSLRRISESADETLYECVLEHELALLNKTTKSAVYLDMSVPQLVKAVILEHMPHGGFKVDMSTLREYPAREMIIQWRETDLQFIQRLLAEVGIFWRFENHPDVKEEVMIIFDDSGKHLRYSSTTRPYVRFSGLTSHHVYVTELQDTVNVVPASVVARNYNYRTPDSPENTFTVNVPDVPENILTGREYRYPAPHLVEGDFYGDKCETDSFFARVRHEYHLNNQFRLAAITNDPDLITGDVFQIVGAIPQAFSQGMIITEMTLSGSRSESYRARLTGIPDNDRVCFRPEPLPRPVISGTVPARVSSSHDTRYGDLDLKGRYHVKFDFDLEEKKKGFESAFVRLGRPYAGDTYGFHFPLLDGTEVAVAFEHGDPDRPFIAHALHDASRPDLVTAANERRNVIRTPANNKIRLDDERGREHIKVATEFGKSQLNLGHLVDASRKPRGEGVETRTDGWLAARAAKGLLLTTEPQPRAQGKQLDMAAAIAALESALALARTLQQCADTAGADGADTALQQQLSQALNQLSAPGLLAYADKGIAQLTPESVQLTAGKDLIATAGNNACLSIFTKFSLAAGEAISLFSRKLGIKLIAASGNVVTQAQRGEMHLFSQQDLTLATSQGRMNASAKNGIQITCGGGGVRIHPNGAVEIFSPVKIELKAPVLRYMAGESMQVTPPLFEKDAFKRRYLLHAADDAEQILANQKFRLMSSSGEVIEGETDAEGHSPLLDAADLSTYKMELL